MFESQAAEPVSARDFVERELRANPDLTFPEIQARGTRQGLAIQPFLYGSIRRALGLPPRPEVAVAARPSIEPVRQLPELRVAPVAPKVEAAAMPEPEPEPQLEPMVAAAPAEASAPTPSTPAVAGAPKISAFDFAVDALRMSPEMTFQDLKARAGLVGLEMPPIVYGRAKALLGLVPTKPRRPKVEPPRLLRQVDSAEAEGRLPALDGIRSLEQLVETVRALENERRRLNAALAAIQDAVREALAAEDDAALPPADG